jgi:cyclopropane fatty-acyl-phospholipid synthase-like methyltransferase
VTAPVDFDALYATSDDPWQMRTRWYEARRRALILATLPAQRYANAWEPGCANGELTYRLADRCDRLTATDASAQACTLTRSRVLGRANVDVRRHALPEVVGGGPFDLVLLCEVAYYLDDVALARCLDNVAAALADGGTVLACHWRHPATQHAQRGDAVQEAIDRALGLPLIARHREADFDLAVWCADPRSVAQREGIA